MAHWLSTINSSWIEGFVAGIFCGSVVAFIAAACLHAIPRDEDEFTGD